MSKDIENAKKLLQGENLTCVLCKGETVHKNTKSGIAPMLSYIEQGVSLSGFSAADRVVGRAAALLFALAGVGEVYANVMSKAAAEVLKQNNIKYSYGELVPGIKGCKIEASINGITDPKKAFTALQERVKQLGAEKGKNGKNGEIKKLGFGLMRLPVLDANDPTAFDYAAVEKMVDKFMENGFTHFDTAYVYHNEESERLVKKLISSRYPRESYQLSTKLPMAKVSEYDDQTRLFNEQLEKCGVEYFDYYLLHALNREKYKTVQECRSFEFGLEQKAAGKIKNLGFSFHDDAEFFEQVLTEHPGAVDFVLMQINYLDWENPVIQSRPCYEIARKHNIPIMVMEPIKGGQLAAVPEEAEKLMKRTAPNASAASWAVRYAAGLPGVFMVLSGMGNMEQLTDNMSYMRDFVPLTEKEQSVIKTVCGIIEKNTAIGCTGCGYCVKDCPKKIAIPEYFAMYNEHKRYPAAWNPRGYYGSVSKLRGKASDCIKCGLCERVCPQKLKVTNYLADVAKAFEEEGE